MERNARHREVSLRKSCDGAAYLHGRASWGWVTLTGEVDSCDSGTTAGRLSAYVVDRFGTVQAGELVDEENIVAVTFELLVEEVPA